MDENMTYEKAITRLEEIVNLLESENSALDESLKLFEEGTRLTAYCSRLLADAEQKITTLSKGEE